ncbi:unnamed protein product [Parascedosporium putredinis]|uniref:DUF4470 domain-containing protein n=1 Tax=Parascedosporium putredinis TaxID=1442378 RepID=A0A9P1MAR1_9PEZI|nr:unnamed protein product [Parascedosporium putredinis]CAI7994812.1 unnamed protein product [Parascedosporium putredinis]
MATPAHISSSDYPPTLNNVRNSYKPAASLTRSVPQGIGNVEILALGSSQLKNILYTAYHEKGLPQRTTHITVVDSFQLDIALNAIFLTLIQAHGRQIQDTDLEQLWEIITSAAISKKPTRRYPFSEVVQFEEDASLAVLATHIHFVVSAVEADADRERSIGTPFLGEAKENDEINRYVVSAAPFRSRRGAMSAVSAAKVSFIEWTHALAEAIGNTLTVSFVNADPHSYLDALHRHAQGDTNPSHYRTGHSSLPLQIASAAVTEFDVIDASHVTGNRLRILLTLAFAAPLLKNQPWATVFTEFNIRLTEMKENPLEDVLYGDTQSMCLLLGLSTPEIVTNSSSAAIVDDVLLGVEDDVPLGSQMCPVYYRLAWKHCHSLAGSAHQIPLSMTVDNLVNLLMELDDKMYELDQRYTESVRNRTPSGLYRVGLLAPLLQAAARNVTFDIKELCDRFFDHAPREARRPAISEELPELAIQLHARGLYSSPYLAESLKIESDNGRLDLPSVAAVSIVVHDYSHIQDFFDVEELITKAMVFEARITNGPNKLTMFRDLQVMTANALQTSLSTNSINFKDNSIHIRSGAPKHLVFTFWAPASLLTGSDVEVELVGVPYPLLDIIYGINICKGKLSHSISETGPSFLLTAALPTSAEEPIFFSRAPTAAKNPDAIPQEKEDVDRQDITSIQFNTEDKSGSVVARQVLHSEKGRQLLAEKAPITIKQSGPYSIDIVFGKKKDTTIYTVNYPTTVTSVGSKTRIARKSGYVEVIAKAPTPDASAISDLIFPSTLSSDAVPVSLNLPSLNLDSLPLLDISDETANKWITTLTSFQFSSRESERSQANEKTGMVHSTRVNFKESLFSMFMTSTGLQGGQTGLFALNQPGEDGVHMLIFVSAVRLDCASNSIVLDAAVMPMTTEMLKDPEIEGFLLLLRTLEICSLDVDEAELKAWKKALPAFAERCRTWEHHPTCEYKAAGATIPLSLDKGEPVLCSCGKGRSQTRFSIYRGGARRRPSMREQEVCQKKDWKKHRFECKEAAEQSEG